MTRLKNSSCVEPTADLGFEALFQRHYESVFRLCWRFLGHRQDAEDAAQETLWRLYRYAARRDPERSLGPYLKRIASNRCRTYYARRQRRASATSTSTEAVAEQVGPVISDRRDDDLREEVRLATATLNDNQRNAFLAHHVEQLSYDDIAARLGCRPDTAKVWVHRARVRIAETLRARGVVAPSRPSQRPATTQTPPTIQTPAPIRREAS